MDGFTAQHLRNWIDTTVAERDQDTTLESILALLHYYPELPETHSWSEIRMLAERYSAIA